ncbi:hypothetical protein GW7_19023 [Heterocephalus glaber]|uniref:EF-hand domain-containing protein n=1 Tax=Heterocephalus glaber TaxID=10181 RepID=G5BA98_HETGA|nr:hypothetical protein GW7_19023 [Heterocephalus glaber]
MVCRQLNMEESVAEIMSQLGADENGKISFQDFTRCRMQLVQEIRKEEVDLSVKSDNSCKKKKLRDRIDSWPTSSDNSLGALSAARESWEYDSGARDLQSPDLQTQSALQKLLEYGGSSLHQQAALHKLLTQSPHFGSSVGGHYLELANTIGRECGFLPTSPHHQDTEKAGAATFTSFKPWGEKSVCSSHAAGKQWLPDKRHRAFLETGMGQLLCILGSDWGNVTGEATGMCLQSSKAGGD